MTNAPRPNHPEPLPPASELAAIAFLAGVEGYIVRQGGEAGLRLTMHRTVTIAGKRFIQQVGDYLGAKETQIGGGRVFPVTLGAMGEAYRLRRIVRTRHYADLDSLRDDIARELKDQGKAPDVEAVALSYLAVPILGKDEGITCIIYADTKSFNFFADDERVETIVAMARSFASLIEERAIPRIQNFPQPFGEEEQSIPTVYRRVQEDLESPLPPRFRKMSSFNFEIVV